MDKARQEYVKIDEYTENYNQLIEIQRRIMDDEGFDFASLHPASYDQLTRRVKVGGVGGFKDERTDLLETWQYSKQRRIAAQKLKKQHETLKEQATKDKRGLQEKFTLPSGKQVLEDPRQFNVKYLTFLHLQRYLRSYLSQRFFQVFLFVLLSTNFQIQPFSAPCLFLTD